MSSLLKEILNPISTKQQSVTERFENYSDEELFHEIIAQYKNLEVYKPRSPEELYKTSGAIIGSAQDLIDAIQLIYSRRLEKFK